MMTELVSGIYQHYKGNQYRVMGVARHSETEEELVVYRPMYGEAGLWVRPKSMFVEQVQTSDGLKQRFSLLEAD